MSALSPPRGAQSPGPASVPGTTQWRVPHREPGEWGLQPPTSGTCLRWQLGEEVRSVLLGEALTLD